MGKKKKNREQAAPQSREGAEPEGLTRVLLLRHGESLANATGEDVLDPPLTEKGRGQAAAWAGHIGRLGAEAVLVSPLRRAVETALLAFEGVDVPVELCRPARELWWNEQQNTLAPQDDLEKLLPTLPRGTEVFGVDEAFAGGPDDAANEEESMQALRGVLALRGEPCLALVCHWGVIHHLCGVSANNCAVIECAFRQRSGHLQMLHYHDHPSGKASERKHTQRTRSL